MEPTCIAYLISLTRLNILRKRDHRFPRMVNLLCHVRVNDISKSDFWIPQVNQGISVYGNKGSTDQHAWVFVLVLMMAWYSLLIWLISCKLLSPHSYIQQLREGVHNFFVTFIEVLRDRPPGHDWELEPGVTCGDYLFGMLQVWSTNQAYFLIELGGFIWDWLFLVLFAQC